MAPRSGAVRIAITLDDKGLDKGAKRSTSTLGRMEREGKRHVSGLAKSLTGVVAALGSVAAAKQAIQTTTTLAKTTLTLSKSFGLATHEASQWAAVSQARGADGKQMTMGFKALVVAVRNASIGTQKHSFAVAQLEDKQRREVESAKKAGKSAADLAALRVKHAGAVKDLSNKAVEQARVFAELGISQEDLVKRGGDLHWVLNRVSDGLANLPPGTEKSAVAAKLFGRTWTTIAPLIREGSEEMNKNLALADKYGATFGGKTISSVQDFIKAQREAKLASLGLQVAFGTQVAPSLTKVIGVVTRFVAALREGDPKARALAIGLGLVVAGLIGFKVISTVVSGMQALKVATVAVNLAMRANPIGVVITVLVALGFALVVAYKKSETFRNVVNGVFGAVKSAAVAAIRFILGALDKFMGVWSTVLGALGHVPGFGWAKDASRAIDKAREATRNWANSLDDVAKDRKFTMTVTQRTVKATHAAEDRGAFTDSPARRRAWGGPVPGTGFGDIVPAMLTPGEHVWTKDEVAKAGGHSAVMALRRAVQKFSSGGIVSRANRLEGMRKPYLWGGGHGDGGKRGFDCSGAVSWVLGIPPRVSGAFTGFGKPGPGSPNDTKVFANRSHVFMVINGRGFGTSRENPGGGPGWISYNYRPGFTVRHLEDSGKGGSTDKKPTSGDPQERSEPGKKRVALEREVQRNMDRIDSLRNQLADLPSGKAGASRRKAIQGQIRGLTTRDRHLNQQIKGLPSAVDQPTKLERGLASADLALAKAEGTKDPADDIEAYRSRRKAMFSRLRRINVALRRGHLSSRKRVELVTEKAQLLRDIRQTNTSIGDLRPDKPTPGALAELGVATASLTPDLGDDYTAAGKLFGVREKELAAARKTGDTAKITEAISNLKAAGDDLKAAAEAIEKAWTKGFEDRLASLDAASVIAKVETPGDLSDDLRVLNEQLGLATEAYSTAKGLGDEENVVRFGNIVLSTRDAIEALTQVTVEAVNQDKELLELLRAQLLDAQRAYNTSQAQYGTLEQAIAEIVSRQQGGRVGLASQSAGVAGRVASGIGR